MSTLCNPYYRGFFSRNFPYIEKEFDALTDYELIAKILEHLENEIKAVDNKYSGIGDTVEQLEADFIELQESINTTLDSFKTEVENDVDSKLEAEFSRIVLLLAEYQTVIDGELSTLRADLEQEIEAIELGNVKAYNPTNRRNRKRI